MLFIVDYLSKTKKNKKTITKHLTSGFPIRWEERFYKIGQTYLGKQLGSNYFSTLFKTTNSNVCQLRVVFYIKYNDVFLMTDLQVQHSMGHTNGEEDEGLYY